MTEKLGSGVARSELVYTMIPFHLSKLDALQSAGSWIEPTSTASRNASARRVWASIDISTKCMARPAATVTDNEEKEEFFQ